jgi:spermidine/putrescine-binding protein
MVLLKTSSPRITLCRRTVSEAWEEKGWMQVSAVRGPGDVFKGVQVMGNKDCDRGQPPIAATKIPILAWLAGIILALGLLQGCRDAEPPAKSSSPTLAKELVFSALAEDMPQWVLDAFTREFGVKIRYLPFQSPEEADENIRSGQRCDVVLIENQLVPSLINDGLLAEIDFAHVSNFKYISANFRDLALDPGNRHSVPGSYGTTGLVVRTDLVGTGLNRWADLWKPQYAGKIGLRAQPREIIGMTLTSLGYAFASENPRELAEVRQRLLELKPAVVLLDIEADDAVRKLLNGEIAILHGYAEDFQEAHAGNPAVSYILPKEGTALWGESYAIVAGSPEKYTAELLINFLLRPEITARIIEEKKYAHPNDAALPLVKPEIRNDPVIFPPNQDLENGAIILPLSPAGKKLYADIWARFLAGTP